MERRPSKKKKHSTKKKEHQSPIDITKDIVIQDKLLKGSSLQVHYQIGDAEYVKITRTGFLCVCKENCQSSISASHLKPDADYRLWQFHMHWSDTNDKGSEHCIDGKHFAGEIHCVFWNKALGTRQEAMHHMDGFTVLAIFLDVHDEDNPVLSPIIDAVDRALESQEKQAPVLGHFDLARLLPEKHSYYSYDGSLTTAPYAECVTWTILHRHVPISNTQLNVLRKIIGHNARSLQTLYDRVVHASFHRVPKKKHVERENQS